MTTKEINERALDLLDNRDWYNAQALFFQNARIAPSYKTYNNLGYYLISEGLTLRSGVSRNAYKLGLKYILKSIDEKKSAVNLFALATAYDYRLRRASDDERKILYNKSYLCLDEALKIEYSDVILYNILRLSMLEGRIDESILEKSRQLIKGFLNEDSVTLHLSILRKLSAKEEGLKCIDDYGAYLEEVDLLFFYSGFGYYKEGFDLCRSILDKYSIDKFIASAIIECCANTERYDEMKNYSDIIKERESESIHRSIKAEELEMILGNSTASSEYRKNLIKNYYLILPFMKTCCYFGCNTHGVPF